MRVVIAPASPTGDLVLDCLRSWSRCGLLDPFCWWTVPELPDEPDLTVRLVDDGGIEERTLPVALKGSDPADLRIVALAVIAAGEHVAETFAEDVSARLALATTVVAVDPDTPTECTMLVAAQEIGQPVPPSIFRPEWAANVYVAPEDCAAPGQFNQLPGNDEAFPLHVAHALATLADVWSDRRPDAASLLDTLRPVHHGAMVAPIRVARSFSHLIDFGYIADHLAATVFQPGDAWPNPDPERLDRVRDPGSVIPDVTSQYLQAYESVIGLSPFEPITIPGPEVLGLWASLMRLIKDVLGRLRRKPSEYIEEQRRRGYEKVAALIERGAGPDSGWRVERWREKAQSGDTSPPEEFERAIMTPDGPFGAAWTDLRRISFGLVDGAPMPSLIDPMILDRRGKRVLVTNPAAIVPDPSAQLPPGEYHPAARVCDPQRFDPRYAPKPEPPAGAPQDVVAPPVDAGPPPDEDGAPDEPSPFDLAAWAAPFRDSFLWRVGASIAAATAEARMIAEAQVEEETEEERAARAKAALEPKRKGFLKRLGGAAMRLLIGWVLVLVAAYFAWTKLDVIPAAGVTVLLVLVWLYFAAVTAQGLIMRRRKRERDDLQDEFDRINEEAERALRRGDILRLKNRYAEFLDWAEMIGWIVYRPWVGEALGRMTIPAPVEAETLPSAFGLAVGVTTEQRIQILSSQAQARVFHAAWLTRLYDGVQSLAMDEVLEFRAFTASVGRGGPDPASDASEDPDAPRTRLLDAIRRGDHRQLTNNEFTQDLLEFLEELPLDGISPGVAVVGQDAADDDEPPTEPMPPTTAWFSPPDNLPTLVERLRPTVVRILAESAEGRLGGTGVILGDGGLIATARHVVEGATSLQVRYFDGSSGEAKVVRAAPATDLALLSTAPYPAARSAAISDNLYEMRQGEPLITLGHPMSLKGDPTLAWGLVTSMKRRSRLIDPPAGVGEFNVIEATYNSAPGASGSPVFDLTGRIVGIHSGGSHTVEENPKAGYLSISVPVTELEILLDQVGISVEPDDEEPAAITLTTPPAGLAIQDPNVLPTPSSFLEELVPAPGPIALLRQHWVRPLDEHFVELVTPNPPDLGDHGLPTRQLTGSPRFLKPLRVVLHRVELTPAVEASSLSSCAETDGDDI